MSVFQNNCFFIGSQLVALSPVGRVGVWHATTKTGRLVVDHNLIYRNSWLSDILLLHVKYLIRKFSEVSLKLNYKCSPCCRYKSDARSVVLIQVVFFAAWVRKWIHLLHR